MPLFATDLSPTNRKPRQAAIRLARLTALVSVGIAGYLLWASLAASGRVAGCDNSPGSDCASVLVSRWSSWLGLPVGLPAVVVYLSMLALLFCIGPKHPPQTEHRAWQILVLLATLAAGAALWFAGLQIFVLKSVCPYCMALHACGLALAAFVFWCAPIRWRSKAAESAGPLALTSRNGATSILIGLVGVGVLIGGQFAVSPPAANIQIIEASKFKPSNSSASFGAPKPPAVATPSPSPLALGVPPHHPIIVVGGRATIDAGEVPLLGDPDADTVVVEVFDYTCPECRSLHRHMQEARDRYGRQLAWALLPTPINASCNKYVPVTKPPHERACEYARLALAVWIARPAAFGEYHNWLMQPVEPPPLAEARQRASELIAPKALDAALADARIDRQLAADVGIYHLAGDGAVPKLLIDGSVLVGSPATTDKLCEVLEKYGRLTK